MIPPEEKAAKTGDVSALEEEVKKREELLKKRMEDLRKREDDLKNRGEERRRETDVREREVGRRRADMMRADDMRRSEGDLGAGDPGDIIFIGVDFGTSRFSVSTSTGIKRMSPSVVGWPKDDVAREFLRRDVVFGEEALKNRLALDIHYPLEKGMLAADDVGKGIEAARELFAHMINPIKEPGKKTFCVVGVPIQASTTSKQAMVEVARGIVDAVMIASEPFLVAYSTNKLNNSLIVDMGAGGTDMCRVHGTIPTESDQKFIPMGGNYIDDQLLKLVQGRFKNAQVTKEMARKWKETSGTLIPPKHPITVQFPINGVPTTSEITEELVEACRSIVSDISIGIKSLIATYDPEFQDTLRRNVVLSGGGGQLTGLGRILEEELEDIRVGPISIVPDPLYCGADGALKLCRDTPRKYWEELMLM